MNTATTTAPVVEYRRRRGDVYFVTCDGREVRYDASNFDTRITFDYRAPKSEHEVYVISPYTREVVKWSDRAIDEDGRTFYPYPSADEMARVRAVNDLIVGMFA